MTSSLSLVPGEASWRARKVRYYSGDWHSIQTVLPDFELVPFAAGPGEPINPFLQTVMRLPLTAVERPIPVGVVSHTYSLAPHRKVAALCRQGVIEAGIEANGERYEVGVSELGEWMNFRIYFPDSYSYVDARGNKLDLRLECFNSVEGSCHLVILFGWYRLVCSNGMVIGESIIEIKDRHGQQLEIQSIPERIRPALDSIVRDRSRMAQWQSELVSMEGVGAWANDVLSEEWGKKAATRVFHICESGNDIEIDDPFAPGAATEKPVRYLNRVPGSPERASTKYDVSQALSFVATHRNNTEERVSWQRDIPHLLEQLTAAA